MGKDFVKLTSKAVCCLVVLFWAICKNYIVCHFQHLESLAFGTDLKSCLQCGKPIPMAKENRFALGVNLNKKSGCAASLTLCGLLLLQHLRPGDKTDVRKKA